MQSQSEIIEHALSEIMEALKAPSKGMADQILSQLHTDILKADIKIVKTALVKILAYQTELNKKYPEAMPQGNK